MSYNIKAKKEERRGCFSFPLFFFFFLLFILRWNHVASFEVFWTKIYDILSESLLFFSFLSFYSFLFLLFSFFFSSFFLLPLINIWKSLSTEKISNFRRLEWSFEISRQVKNPEYVHHVASFAVLIQNLWYWIVAPEFLWYLLQNTFFLHIEYIRTPTFHIII
jgi:hypothetical protein